MLLQNISLDPADGIANTLSTLQVYFELSSDGVVFCDMCWSHPNCGCGDEISWVENHIDCAAPIMCLVCRLLRIVGTLKLYDSRNLHRSWPRSPPLSLLQLKSPLNIIVSLLLQCLKTSSRVPIMYSSSVSGWKYAKNIFLEIVGNEMHKMFFSIQTNLHFDLIFLFTAMVTPPESHPLCARLL